MGRFRPGSAFAVLCLGFVCGVAVASYEMPVWVLGIIFALLVGFTRLSYRIKDVLGFVLVFFLAAFFGVWRYGEVQPTLQSVAVVADGEKHAVEGVIIRREESDTNIKLTLANVQVDGEARKNRILVKTSLFAEVRVGERVSVFCSLKRPEPFEDFAYDRYLAAKDVFATCTASSLPFVLGESDSFGVQLLARIEVIQHFIFCVIDAVFPDPHAQLFAGLLIGDDAFSSIWKERFLRTGTSHIVAASGSNVALTVSLVLGVLFGAGIRRKYATIFVLFGILLFVFLAGAESAVIRAGIMASLVVIARATGRASSVRNVLLCTASVMLWFEPRILRDDVGFQLSVLSTIGLVWWSKFFAQRLSFLPEKFGIREGFATTLAATLATLPVTAFGMGQISLVGPLANLLVLPLLPFAMTFGVFATVVGMVFPMLGRLVAFPAWWILDTVLMILRELSLLPFVYIEVEDWVLDVLLGFGGIGVAIVRSVLRRLPFRLVEMKGNFTVSLLPAFLFGCLFVTSFVQHVMRDGWFSSGVRVWVFDVGQGDGIFIDTPEKDVVIDGGLTFLMREKLGMVLPWFDRSVDYVFLTHPHADHVVGLVSLVEYYGVDFFGDTDQGCSSLECSAVHAGISSYAVQKGDVFSLTAGVTLRVLWPEEVYAQKKLSDPNAGSLVLLLETPHGSMLFTGDAGVEEEHVFLESISESVDVLKVGHHGSRTSTSQELLRAIAPDIGIISLGDENSFGHPHEEVLDRLSLFGVEVYRTDLLGDILVEFEKNGPIVSSFSL